MKIDYAIVASDDNPTYLDFWPIVAKLWLRLGITPVLLYFGKTLPQPCGGKIVTMQAAVNPPLATCWARYWWVGQQEEKVSIISDIDMLPFSRWYFVDQIKKYETNAYIHLNPCLNTYTRLPSCYHVATGRRFQECLSIKGSFEESFSELLSKKFDENLAYQQEGLKNKWCYDEFHATELLLKRDDIVYIQRDGGQNGRRIDRSDWCYDDRKCKDDYYFDSHSIRPYGDYKKQIDRLLSFYDR